MNNPDGVRRYSVGPTHPVRPSTLWASSWVSWGNIPHTPQSDSRTKVFCTCAHIKPQTVTSSNWLDSYCCMRSQHTEDSCPNFDHYSMHKLSAYPQESDSPFLIGHRSGGEKPN